MRCRGMRGRESLSRGTQRGPPISLKLCGGSGQLGAPVKARPAQLLREKPLAPNRKHQEGSPSSTSWERPPPGHLPGPWALLWPSQVTDGKGVGRTQLFPAEPANLSHPVSLLPGDPTPRLPVTRETPGPSGWPALSERPACSWPLRVQRASRAQRREAQTRGQGQPRRPACHPRGTPAVTPTSFHEEGWGFRPGTPHVNPALWGRLCLTLSVPVLRGRDFQNLPGPTRKLPPERAW